MQDRREIREGAGLEEARLNQDFIEFLRKWSTPILVVIALVAVGYAGYTRWVESQHKRLNDAYAEYERVSGVQNPSPESLKRVAEDYEDVGGVALLARLQAADVYLQSVRRGVKPGAAVDPQGNVTNKDDLIAAEDRKAFLDQAQSLYEQVASKARKDDAQRLIAIGATFGLAAVAECREDYEGARKQYDAAAALAKDTAFSPLATVAAGRVSSLDSVKQVPHLYAAAELPAAALAPPSPLEPQRGPAPVPQPQAPTPPPAPQGPPADAPGSDAGSQPQPSAPPAESPKEPAPAPAPGESPK